MDSIFNQLQGNQFGGNGAEAACVFGSAGQVVNHILCQPTGVRDVDVIDILGPAIVSLFSKNGE